MFDLENGNLLDPPNPKPIAYIERSDNRLNIVVNVFAISFVCDREDLNEVCHWLSKIDKAYIKLMYLALNDEKFEEEYYVEHSFTNKTYGKVKLVSSYASQQSITLQFSFAGIVYAFAMDWCHINDLIVYLNARS